MSLGNVILGHFLRLALPLLPQWNLTPTQELYVAPTACSTQVPVTGDTP